MEIAYLGHSSFSLKGSSATLVTDPFDEKIGLKFPKISADIVTVSHGHDDHNKTKKVSDIKRVVDGPGEYEIQDVSLIGISTYHDDKKGELRGRNIVFIIEMDGLRIAHLGDLGHTLKEKEIDIIGEIDILMVPVGGEYTLDGQRAAEVSRAIAAKITIPMHYQTKGLEAKTFAKLTSEEPFLSDLGLPVEREKKLKIKKELMGEDQKVVVLERI